MTELAHCFKGLFKSSTLAEMPTWCIYLATFIHMNPVLTGLVERPEDWEFSSYREYIGMRDGTLPTPGVVLSQFASSEAYREFVESYAAWERAIIADLLFD